MLQRHRFTVAISQISVNHDGRGETAPDPLVKDQESKVKKRKVEVRVIVDLAMLPGPPGFLGGLWVQGQGGGVTDVASWTYSVCVLRKFASSLGSLHWPAGAEDMGIFLCV